MNALDKAHLLDGRVSGNGVEGLRPEVEELLIAEKCECCNEENCPSSQAVS